MNVVEGLVSYIEKFKYTPGMSIKKVITFDNDSKIKKVEVTDKKEKHYKKNRYFNKNIRTHLDYEELYPDIVNKAEVSERWQYNHY